MAGRRVTQRSFLGGELTDIAEMRRDKPFYENGAAALENQTLRVQGAAETRGGWLLIDTVEGPTLEFEWLFNPTQAYHLVFTAGRLRVYDNIAFAKVFDTTTGCPWTSAHFEEMTFTQQLDTMFVAHSAFQTVKILRTSATTFTLDVFTFSSNTTSPNNRVVQPHYRFASTAITLTPSATSGTITLTASASFFVSGHVGTRLRLKSKEVEITAVTSGTVATALVKETLVDTAATDDWTEQVFSAVRGWARTVQFFGDRLVFGGSRDRPLGWWASKIGNYANFDLGTSLDNEAIWEAIGEADVSEIRHLVVDRHMLVFCDGAVFQVSNSETTPLTPKNFKIPPQSLIGASYLRPKTFDGGVIYVQSESNLVRVLRYNDVDQKYNAETANMLSPHLIKSPVRLGRTFAVAPRQENIALLANAADGTIAAYHANTENEISAWTPWVLGGGMFVESVSAVREVIWCVARLGADRLLMRYDWAAPPLDAATSLDSVTPTRTWTLPPVMVGQTVSGWSNGYDLGTAVVQAGGIVTFPDTSPDVTSATIGFAFRQHIRPLPISLDTNTGDSHGRVVGLIRYYLDVKDSGVFSADGATPNTVLSTDPSAPAPTFTGIIAAFHLGWDETAQFDLVIDRPQSLTLRGFTREVRLGQ